MEKLISTEFLYLEDLNQKNLLKLPLSKKQQKLLHKSFGNISDCVLPLFAMCAPEEMQLFDVKI